MPVLGTNQITGGAFQDPAGNLLANGYLLFQLNQDSFITSTAIQICADSAIKVPLDVNGNVVTSPAYYLYANNSIIPPNSFYTMSGHSARGQLVYGPVYVSIPITPNPFDLGTLIPGDI
jgi:hypothetical protein